MGRAARPWQDGGMTAQAEPPAAARRPPRPAGAAPSESRLREAALAHLARFAATEAGLRRVLQRRVDRWARRAEAEGADPAAVAAAATEARAAAARVAQRLAGAGVVDDAAFAEARARRLTRGGRSRRAIAAHLAGKGVAREVAAAALPDAAAELDAALAHCRRRRIGPFARAEVPRVKALAALARAGFSQEVAEAALDTTPDAAEARLLALRRG
jgi:regulatory protein